MTLADLRLDAVVLGCAVSAGIHGALVREHFEEEGAGAGFGFLVATVVLAVLAVVLTRRATRAALAGTALVFAGLILAYALAVTTGVPVLHPEVEAVDGVGLFSKAVEAVALAAACSLVGGPAFGLAVRTPKEAS